MRLCNATELRMCCLVAATALWVTAGDVSAQSVTYNFEDGTDQGFGTGFGNDASASFQPFQFRLRLNRHTSCLCLLAACKY